LSRAEARAVWLLATGQMLGYACFYYIFAALVVAWHDDLGWDKALLALGPTLAILIAAGLAPFVGRAVDRGRGPWLLTAGVLVGAGALAVLAEARQPWVYLAGWAGLGVTQAICLYEVCFALLIRRFGLAARAAITRVTLVAGLASTLCFPAVALLTVWVGWRGALWVGVAVALLVILPLHWVGAREIARGPSEGRPHAMAAPRPWEVVRRPGFVGLATMFSLMNLNHWMLISFMLPVFAAQGLAQGLAVAAASTIGPAQVLGRLALMRSEARVGTVRATVWTLVAVVAASGLLAMAGAAPLLAFAFAGVQGAAMGVMTILRPVLVADKLGSGSYGAIAGMMSIPTLIATALAPLVGALVLSLGGEALLIGLALVLGLAALGLALAITRAA
jgi:MFS family permease